MPDDLILLRTAGLGGVNERWTPEMQAAARFEDARRDPRGGWTRCGGYRAILDPVEDPKDGGEIPAFTGTGVVNSMHWSAVHNGGIQYLIWEMGGKLVYFNGSTKSWEVLKTDRYTTSQPWQRTQYVSVGNNTWILNGENQPLRFDGERVHPAGFASAPTSPSCRGIVEGFVAGTSYANLGLGNANTYDDSGDGEYVYVRTEVNEFGTESPPSPVSNAVRWREQPLGEVTTPDGIMPDPLGTKYFVEVDVPAADGRDTVASRIYRCRNAVEGTLNYGTTFYFVREVRTSARVKFIDIVPDSAMGSKMDPTQFGPWPRGAKYAVFWQNTMWVAGMAEYPNRLAYSGPLQLENFPGNNFFNVGDGRGGEITGLYAAKNALIVFMRRGIYVVFGNARDGFYLRDYAKEDGSEAPNAICEIPGVGVMFVSRAGVKVIPLGEAALEIPAARPQPLGNELQDTWRHRVNHGALMNACARVYHHDEEVWLLVPIDGQPDNRLACIYHYGRGRGDWTFRPNMPFSCMVESGDHRGHLFLGSHDDTNHPGVHVYSPGWADKDGDAIEFVYETVPMDFGIGRYESFSVKTLQLFVLGYGHKDARVDYYKDRRATPDNAVQKRRDQQDPTYEIPVWGATRWSATETWYRHRPLPLRFDPNVTCREFAFRMTPEGRVQILDWEVGLKGTVREVRTLNPAIPTGSAPNR